MGLDGRLHPLQPRIRRLLGAHPRLSRRMPEQTRRVAHRRRWRRGYRWQHARGADLRVAGDSVRHVPPERDRRGGLRDRGRPRHSRRDDHRHRRPGGDRRDPHRPLAPCVYAEPKDSAPGLRHLRDLGGAPAALGRRRPDVERRLLGDLGPLPLLVRARPALLRGRGRPEPLRSGICRQDARLARRWHPAARRPGARAARPLARNRLLARRPRAAGWTTSATRSTSRARRRPGP